MHRALSLRSRLSGCQRRTSRLHDLRTYRPRFIPRTQPHALFSLRNYVYTPQEAQKYATELYDLVSAQKLNVRIHGEYPFTAEGVQQAERDLSEGKTVGKLLIKIADE